MLGEGGEEGDGGEFKAVRNESPAWLLTAPGYQAHLPFPSHQLFETKEHTYTIKNSVCCFLKGFFGKIRTLCRHPQNQGRAVTGKKVGLPPAHGNLCSTQGTLDLKWWRELWGWARGQGRQGAFTSLLRRSRSFPRCRRRSFVRLIFDKSVHASWVIQLCLTLCNPMNGITCQDPLSLGFPRQEYWSGLTFPPPGDLLNPGIEPMSLVSCTGRPVLYNSTTWEALVSLF